MSRKILSLILSMVTACVGTHAQSVHFSQYYNAPILVTAANTALLPDNDYRLGMNYRNQWSALPVPFNTFSAWGDLKIGGNKEKDHPNWLGVGFAVYTDKAGDGELKLNQFQGNLAYHLTLSQTAMISLGMQAATVSRSVNYDKLTWDAQWDGISFNSALANGEKQGIIRTGYYTVGAGLNLAFFPNENVYVKIGAGAVNINKPVESFYGGKNALELRPSATADVLLRTGESLIINPSVYYTMQQGAMQLVGGSMFRINLTRSTTGAPMQLLLGGYYRAADAAIGTAGLQIGSVQFVTSYDMTMSSLAPYNAAYGALEFSLIYVGNYGRNKGNLKRSFACPRFS